MEESEAMGPPGVDDRHLCASLDGELSTAVAKLAKAQADVRAVTATAMDLARRLDESEKREVALQEELQAVRATELADATNLSAQQADVIARQARYIQGLRRQVERPGRLVAKRILRAPQRLVGRG